MKMKKLSKGRKVTLAMGITLIATLGVAGQQLSKFAQIQQENAMELRHYSWKSRMEVRKDGETKSIQLSLMRSGFDGTVQKTPISATPQAQLPTRGLRGLIAKKKKEEFLETLDELGALAKSYGELSPERMQRFVTNATVTPEISAQQSLIRIEGRDVLQPGDSMTVWVDAATRKQRRVEIQTTLDRKAVRIVSEFQLLPNGLSYMARSVIDYQGQELTVITENFDYLREQKQS